MTDRDWSPILRLAYQEATKSPDPSTQNGAILVRPTGHPIKSTLAHNKFPDGVKYTDDRWERPLKYSMIEHAERGSLYAAARWGQSTHGLTMVCPWAACADCARGIIECGIVRLVTHQQAHDRSPERWRESIQIAFDMLDEAGVEVTYYDGVVGALPVRHTGEVWVP